ncbi:hypothetical protein R1sor_007397 [Riccia sorocarpa]|uniref:Uncharacterized protein n=1 Tax=Riccia sorocarpa TaxID=122646 RepID=A0ABD3HUI3_9MARC
MLRVHLYHMQGAEEQLVSMEKTVLDGKKELVLIGDAPFEYTEPEELVVNSSVASSEPSVVGDDSLEDKALCLSKKMSSAAEAAWRDGGEIDPVAAESKQR